MRKIEIYIIATSICLIVLSLLSLKSQRKNNARELPPDYMYTLTIEEIQQIPVNAEEE